MLRILHTREPGLDLVRCVDVGLSGADDRSVLEWAALDDRVLLTHDFETMLGFAHARVRTGREMPGVIAVNPWLDARTAAEGILTIALASLEHELQGQVRFVPFR